MIKYVECPEYHLESKISEYTVFLAGGISNCHNWQADIVDMFEDTYKPEDYDLDLILINPRRANFDIEDPDMSREQIEWEFEHLHAVDLTLFWFPPETLCPITLFELGAAASDPNRQIVVGCHPDYARKFDVEVQLALQRPGAKVVVHTSLDGLVKEVNDTLHLLNNF